MITKPDANKLQKSLSAMHASFQDLCQTPNVSMSVSVTPSFARIAVINLDSDEQVISRVKVEPLAEGENPGDNLSHALLSAARQVEHGINDDLTPF